MRRDRNILWRVYIAKWNRYMRPDFWICLYDKEKRTHIISIWWRVFLRTDGSQDHVFRDKFFFSFMKKIFFSMLHFLLRIFCEINSFKLLRLNCRKLRMLWKCVLNVYATTFTNVVIYVYIFDTINRNNQWRLLFEVYRFFSHSFLMCALF